MEKEVVIIGGGPAGLTAALYTARAQLNPLVIEGYQSGGQLMLTTMVENWPGVEVEGIMGSDLVAKIRAQAEHFGADFLSEDVTEVDLSQRPFVIKTPSQTIHAKSLIISTGASAKWLGLESEKALTGYGVSSCATCDGAFFKDKVVTVIGGGDSAMEEAIFLTRFASHVHLLNRSDKFKASVIMLNRAREHEKITVHENVVVDRINDVEAKKVTGVVLRNTKTDETQELACDGVFVAIGHKPNTDLFPTLEKDEVGYLITQGAKTNVDGVFACGDVQDSKYRQAITAAGSGCMAALEAERWLE